jgi:hypothetical protein
MLVLNLESVRENFVKVGKKEYFLLWTTPSRAQLVSSACPHRGGPLHLASVDPSGRRLVCPWHEMKAPVSRITQSSVPMVRTGTRLTAVFDERAGTSVEVSRRTVKANLAPCQVRTTAGAGGHGETCPAPLAARIASIAEGAEIAA